MSTPALGSTALRRAVVGASIAAAVAIVGPAALATTAAQSATCQARWVPSLGSQPGISANGAVIDMLVFDDGTGPALYAAGAFASVGSSPVSAVAKWDGISWTPVGSGIDLPVSALAVFDDGSGPALYAGGAFTTASGVVTQHVAKWAGGSWRALGSGTSGSIHDLCVFDDGSGEALYACGLFTSAGGTLAKNIAKWDGTTWSPLGSGVAPILGEYATTLAVYDDGNGPALYVGGRFLQAGGVAVHHLARWNGTTWSPVGGGVSSPSPSRVNNLEVFDDGGGPELYVCGFFSAAGGVPAIDVAKWNGSTWSALGQGFANGEVDVLSVVDDGSGPALFAGGPFTSSGGVPLNSIAKWNGTAWSALGSGIGSSTYPAVNAIVQFDDGHGSEIVVGGSFESAGGVSSSGLAKWDGSNWSAFDHGVNDSINALAVFDDDHGPALYACGPLQSAGGAVGLHHIGKWNGSGWSALGTGITSVGTLAFVHALQVFDDGTGARLYVGGEFNRAGGLINALNIASWNGTSWEVLVNGTNGIVRTLAVYDDGGGPALFVGGTLSNASGVPGSIVKWDGANWSSLAGGMTPSPTVSALAVFDDGSGPALFVGGSFASTGFVLANNIVKWTGSSWFALGSGVDADVRALAVFDDGNGPALYAGGAFTNAGGAPALHIAKWNGSTWSAVGAGVDATVRALSSFDDGSGAALCVAGEFTMAGALSAPHIARWNGSTWSAMGSGASGDVLALTTYDDSSGPALFAGGAFIDAFDSHDSFLAKWGCPFVRTGTSYCTSSTSSGGCVPVMSATGHASATASSGFTISVSNLDGQRSGLLFYGIHGQVASPWGSGGSSLLCVKSPTQRMSLLNSAGTAGACDGVLAEDWNSYISAHSSSLGSPFNRGDLVWCQGWFRDPPSPKTSVLSNGLVFSVGP